MPCGMSRWPGNAPNAVRPCCASRNPVAANPISPVRRRVAGIRRATGKTTNSQRFVIALAFTCYSLDCDSQERKSCHRFYACVSCDIPRLFRERSLGAEQASRDHTRSGWQEYILPIFYGYGRHFRSQAEVISAFLMTPPATRRRPSSPSPGT